MKKTFKIFIDCANCANLAQEAACKTKGVKNACVNFMAQKMEIEFSDDCDIEKVISDVIKNCKKIDDEIEISL